jgi:nicotinamidase-related amidase
VRVVKALNTLPAAGLAGSADPVLPVFIFSQGGWVLGDLPTQQCLVRDLVVASGYVAVFVDYTPSPEARYPQAIHEICAATKWMAAHGADINADSCYFAAAPFTLNFSTRSMSLSQQNSPALLLIDIQQAFDDLAYWGGARNNPEAERRAAQLLAYWRANGLPVFHVQHCSTNPVSPLRPGQAGNDFKAGFEPAPGEVVVQKNVNSAFIGTDLQQQLAAQHLTTLVIAGLTTDHCVSTTTRMAGNLGFDTYLVADATATFAKTGLGSRHFDADLIHQTALASLNGEFATVLDTATVIEQLTTSQPAA